MNLSVRLLFAALLLGGLATSASADITWTLNDVTFTNGNTATGFFTTNDAVTTIGSFNIDVTGPATAAAFTATIADSADLPSEVGFAISGFSEFMNLYTISPLTSAGGTVLLTNPSPPSIISADCPGCGQLILKSDTELIGVTPEPLSLVLFGTGLLLIAGLVRRRRTPSRKL